MYYEHYTEVNLFDICDDVFHEKEIYLLKLLDDIIQGIVFLVQK